MKTNHSKLRKITAEFREGILDGGSSDRACFMVSFPLQGYLSAIENIETKLVEGNIGCSNHVWLEMTNGEIIDATADQFSTPEHPMPKVYIGPKPKWYVEESP